MPTLTPTSESSEALTPVEEVVFVPEVTNPALFPSAATFPSSRTFPSSGSITPASGLQLDAVSEGSETLTAISED